MQRCCAVAVVPRTGKQLFAGNCRVAILAGPAVVSLLAKDKKLHTLRLNIAYAADPVVAVITSRATNYSTQYPDLHPSNKSAWYVRKVANRVNPRQILQPHWHFSTGET